MGKEVDKDVVGQRIKQIRLEMGYTQREFIKAITGTHMAPGTVGNWEQGKNLPSPKYLSGIAFFGQIPVDELLYGKQEQKVEASLLFNDQNDVRQYLSIGMNDETIKWLQIEHDIDHDTIHQVLKMAKIYINMNELPEEITIINNR